MLTVKFHSIENRGVMPDEDFEWLIQNINKPMPVMSLNFWQDKPQPWYITVYRGDSVVSVFVDTQKAKFTIEEAAGCYWKSNV